MKLLGFFLITITGFFASAAPNGFTYQGQLISPGGFPVEGLEVTFTVQIFSPGPEECLLYEETHITNMQNSNGVFALQVGTGTRNGSDFEDTSSLTDAFSNALGSFSPSTCSIGSTYTPTYADSRRIRVIVEEGMTAPAVAYNQIIKSAPFAMSASNIDGITSSEILINNNSGSQVLNQNNLEWVFESAHFSELQALIDGSSAQYISSTATTPVDFNNQQLTNVADPVAATDAANKNYVDQNIAGAAADNNGISSLTLIDSGKVLQWDGAQWTAGNPAEDATKLPLAGGSMLGSIVMTAGNSILFNDDDDSHYLGFKAPSHATGTVVWDLPQSDGNAGEAIVTSGAGALSFAPVVNTFLGRSGSVSAQVSDYDANQIDNQAAGDIAANNVQDAINELDSEKLAKTGDNMLGHLQLDDESELHLEDTINNRYVGFKAPSAVVAPASFVWTLPGDDGAVNEVLQTDGVGNLRFAPFPADAVDSVFGRGGAVVAEVGDYRANQILSVPAGGIAANEVQGALNELDTEKADKIVEITAGTGLTGGGDISANRVLGIAVNGVSNTELSDNAVHSANIADNVITADDIAANAVDTSEIADDAVTAAQIATDAVASDEILENSVGSSEIADNAVTGVQIADGAVNTTQLSDNSVTAAKIASGVVTANKLANTTVTSGSYGSDTEVATFTVDAQGRLTAAASVTISENDPKAQTLTSVEVDQLEEIDSVTISNTQWGYLGAMGGQPLEAVDGTALDNVWSTSGILVRTGLGTYATITDNSSNWNTAYSWGNHSSAGYAMAVSLGNYVLRSGDSMSGPLTINSQNSLRLADSDSSHHLALRAPATVSSNVIWTMPNTDGGPGQVLQTNGSGTLDWYSIPPNDNLGNHTATQDLNMNNFGVTHLKQGSAGLPSLSFNGDPNSGVFSPGPDAISITTAGTEALTISSTGFVGVGTSSPERLLQVQGPMRVVATSLPASPAIGDIVVDSGDFNTLKWYDGSDWVQASGVPGSGGWINILLTDTNPFDPQCIYVATVDGTLLRATTVRPNTLQFIHNSMDANSTSNYISIGSTSKATAESHEDDYSSNTINSSLTVTSMAKNCGGMGDMLSTGSVPMIGPLQATQGSVSAPGITFSGDTNTGVWSGGPDSVSISTAGSEVVHIDASGNVGIGATSSNAKLNVDGEIQVGNTSSSCDGTTEGQQRYNSGSKVMEFCNGSQWVNMGGAGVPSGTVAFFDLGACPTGWTAFAGAAGRVIVATGTLGPDSYSLNDTGGAASRSLSSANLPAHSHSVDPPATSTSSAGSHNHSLSGSTTSAGSHSHSVSGSTSTAGSHTHSFNDAYPGTAAEAGQGGPSVGARPVIAGAADTTNSAGSHSHSISGSTSFTGSHSHSISGSTSTGGSHNHTVDIASFSSGSSGSGSAFDIRQPYISLLACRKD